MITSHDENLANINLIDLIDLTDVSVLSRLVKLENGYVNYLYQSNELIINEQEVETLVISQEDIESLSVACNDLSEIKNLLSGRYGYDVSNPAKLPHPWVLGSPLFICLKKQYKKLAKIQAEQEKAELESKSRLSRFADFMVALPGGFVSKIANVTVGLIQNPPGMSSISRGVFGLVDILKKMVDVVDDIIYALRIKNQLGDLSEEAVRGIIGGIVVFLHGYESVVGLYDSYSAGRYEENHKTRFARIITGIIKGLVGVSGVTVGTLYLLGVVGKNLLSLPVALVGSSTLMLTNLVSELVKNIFIFNNAAREATSSKAALEKFKENNFKNDNEENIDEYLSINELDNADNEPLLVDENNLYKTLFLFGGLKHKQKSGKHEFLDAERDMSFAAAEVFTSSIIELSTLLGLVAYVLPGSAAIKINMNMLNEVCGNTGIAGVASGVFLKTFQFLDNLLDHGPTGFLRSSFIDNKPEKKNDHACNSVNFIKKQLNNLEEDNFSSIVTSQSVRIPKIEEQKQKQDGVSSQSRSLFTQPVGIPKVDKQEQIQERNSVASQSRSLFSIFQSESKDNDKEMQISSVLDFIPDSNAKSDSEPEDSKSNIESKIEINLISVSNSSVTK